VRSAGRLSTELKPDKCALHICADLTGGAREFHSFSKGIAWVSPDQHELQSAPVRWREAQRMSTPDLTAQFEAHRRYLFRIARLQLRDDDLAEDVVQDTLVAALQGAARFSGKSSVKTWLTGILKHKIVDAIRHKTSRPALASLNDECHIDDFDALFDETGQWDNPPADWGSPDAALERREFLEVMEKCLEQLPPNTARVFMMREVMELESGEICKELAITSTNLWVIMYRARMSLRACLEQNWFATSPRGPS